MHTILTPPMIESLGFILEAYYQAEHMGGALRIVHYIFFFAKFANLIIKSNDFCFFWNSKILKIQYLVVINDINVFL